MFSHSIIITQKGHQLAVSSNHKSYSFLWDTVCDDYQEVSPCSYVRKLPGSPCSNVSSVINVVVSLYILNVSEQNVHCLTTFNLKQNILSTKHLYLLLIPQPIFSQQLYFSLPSWPVSGDSYRVSFVLNFHTKPLHLTRGTCTTNTNLIKVQLLTRVLVYITPLLSVK